MIELLCSFGKAINWRAMLILQALGQVATFMDSREQPLLGSWMGHPSAGYVATALSVLLLVPIAVVVNEAVRRGAAPKVAYPLAVVSTFPVTFLVTTVTQYTYMSVFGLASGIPDLFWRTSISMSFHTYIYAAFGMLIFVNQRIADRMLETFRDGELQRARLERQLVESRLAMAEAQIDPSMLFDQLAQVKLGFAHDQASAEAQLDELIQTLRTALARTVSVPEPLGHPAP